MGLWSCVRAQLFYKQIIYPIAFRNTLCSPLQTLSVRIPPVSPFLFNRTCIRIGAHSFRILLATRPLFTSVSTLKPPPLSSPGRPPSHPKFALAHTHTNPLFCRMPPTHCIITESATLYDVCSYFSLSFLAR